MNLRIGRIFAACGMIGFFSMGCQAPPKGTSPTEKQDETISLRCRYQAKSTETLRYNNEHTYKNWVEMPNQPATQASQRTTRIMLVVQREVESVEPDGSAIMEVTIRQAQVDLIVNTAQQKKQEHYRSGPEGTESTWSGQPALAGVSYRIKISPDTTVTEIIGLDQLQKDLNVTDSTASLIKVLLSPDGIRKVHQRDFVMGSPAAVKAGEKYDRLLPLPDRMIKAQAVKEYFQADRVKNADNTWTVVVRVTGEAVQSLPKDFPAPAALTEMPQMIIKNSSDMQELTIGGEGRFDAGAGKVLSESGTVNCMLALFEENFMGKKDDKKDDKTAYGIMFTQISINQQVETEP